MSTPIRQGELSPEDPRFYAPPKWRSGEFTAPPIQPPESEEDEVTAPPIQPSLRAGEVTAQSIQTPERPQAFADSTSRRDSMVPGDAGLRSREYRGKIERGGVRTKALAIGAGVFVWIVFCVVVGLGRLDTIKFVQLRNGLPPAHAAEISASERPQPANIVQPVPAPQVLPTTLVVTDASGELNAALPLAIKVANTSPGSTINLSGLAAGTTLSTGSRAGHNQWRIPVDDLPNTIVTAPPDFIGLMTVVAEVRSSDEQAIVRAPVHLVWRPAAVIDTTEAVKIPPPAAVARVEDSIAPKEVQAEQPPANQVEQFAAEPKESTVTQHAPRLKVQKHRHTIRESSLKKRRQHRDASVAAEPDANVTPWRDISGYADSRGDRRRSWNDLQNIIDRSWDRCRFDCDRIGGR